MTTADLAAVVTDRRSLTDLRRYFHGGNAGQAPYTGSWFQSLGAVDGDPNRVNAADILAVGLLNVTIPAGVVVQLLGLVHVCPALPLEPACELQNASEQSMHRPTA